jgi:hypothetical protein
MALASSPYSPASVTSALLAGAVAGRVLQVCLPRDRRDPNCNLESLSHPYHSGSATTLEATCAGSLDNAARAILVAEKPNHLLP